jgi:hypothetical protein
MSPKRKKENPSLRRRWALTANCTSSVSVQAFARDSQSTPFVTETSSCPSLSPSSADSGSEKCNSIRGPMSGDRLDEGPFPQVRPNTRADPNPKFGIMTTRKPRSTLLNHSFPPFYACYLLKSVQTPTSTAYVFRNSPALTTRSSSIA